MEKEEVVNLLSQCINDPYTLANGHELFKEHIGKEGFFYSLAEILAVDEQLPFMIRRISFQHTHPTFFCSSILDLSPLTIKSP